MKIRYDPDADAMYITLRDAEVASTKKMDKTTIVDYDKEGQLIGVEILFVKETNPGLLREIQVENLISA
ncbi:MAG TPA: DUF2283 domain-containing protein [Candidatus Nanoarchaeia archaeon]|nr:DUF2283 domain-containing protein [Candidatus Nanoarchaeia archaeon]